MCYFGIWLQFLEVVKSLGWLGLEETDVCRVADSRHTDIQAAVPHFWLEGAVVDIENDLGEGLALRLVERQSKPQGNAEVQYFHLCLGQVVERGNGHRVFRLLVHEHGNDDSSGLQSAVG